MSGRYTFFKVMEIWQCGETIINTFQGIFKNNNVFLELVLCKSKYKCNHL